MKRKTVAKPSILDFFLHWQKLPQQMVGKGLCSARVSSQNILTSLPHHTYSLASVVFSIPLLFDTTIPLIYPLLNNPKPLILILAFMLLDWQLAEPIFENLFSLFFSLPPLFDHPPPTKTCWSCLYLFYFVQIDDGNRRTLQSSSRRRGKCSWSKLGGGGIACLILRKWIPLCFYFA